jgi:hypothetical protein
LRRGRKRNWRIRKQEPERQTARIALQWQLEIAKENGHELSYHWAAGGALRPSVRRVSLTDSHEGDELILANYEHHGVDSPYRMRFAIYVREGDTRYDAIDQVPEQLRTRTLAVRAFDVDAMMTGCELVDGREVEAAIERLFANPMAAYLHVHFAAPGCYAAQVERA